MSQSRQALLPFPEVEHRIPADRDIVVHAYDWGGDGPTLVLAHATGLHAHVWLPLVQHLRGAFRCIGVDLMAQGATSIPNDGNFAWSGVSNALAVALDALELSGRGDVYAVGHSQGGYAILAAELLRPGTFAGLFAYEPVAFPLLRDGNVLRVGDRWADNPMAQITRRRRSVFPSAAEAINNFAAKPPFAQCDRSVIESYVYWGFKETGVTSAEITLLCTPEVEASLFEYSATNIYEELTDITCPIVFGLGGAPGNFSEIVPLCAQRAQHATLLEFPGRTHFGILEGVEEMAGIVTRSLLSDK